MTDAPVFAILDEQRRRQDRLDRRRMTWWIPWLFVLGLVVSLVGLYGSIVSLRLGERPGAVDALFAVFALLFGVAVGTWLSWPLMVRPRVVPYFARELEPHGGSTTPAFEGGRALHQAMGELEALADRLGVKPLSAFGFADDFYEQEVTWHPAAEGLETVDALRSNLSGGGDAPLTADLDALRTALRTASHQAVDFALALRLYSRESIQAIRTMQPRQGSFW